MRAADNTRKWDVDQSECGKSAKNAGREDREEDGVKVVLSVHVMTTYDTGIHDRGLEIYNKVKKSST